ncbi:amidase domain-containing protein [Romboutsia sp. 1001216sp1]|uniref:amidase domain-containing protein n=1 Tax=unclassified Romboutsia TaxID=2626894 RepID=UPI001FAC421A|nr:MULTISPECIES: amidase domain-containing protein [unclassified Romboutsia]MDB8793681.1 amidase domain-containing protein [Romboutsia sp. 1001216sp1]MDB8795078.1 amidase domain-containing protein [Romboutsia sp. 1001216sp1]MDB8798888.1 amidase domain-containing protein [Romboutsia sp. 1001216sp1]
MIKLNIKNKYAKIIIISLSLTIAIGLYSYIKEGELIIKSNSTEVSKIEDGENNKYKLLLEELFDHRNKAILDKNEEGLKELYEVDKKFGLWAWEHEVKKMKYLENWSSKQGVKFNDIKAKVKIKKVKEKEEGLYGIICTVSTEYKYSYDKEPDIINMCRIGTYHYINVKIIDDQYIITKEWYTDPFVDSLNLDNIKSEDIKNYISMQKPTILDLKQEQIKAIEYAHKYCGAAADEENGLKFNSNYRDYNPEGGDCANFASQIMFESGRFKKNDTWNYADGAGTKAWVNAQAFKNYIVYSGRGSLIAKGSYEDIYKEAYNLRPGDFVAYEKGGRITHVSTVTGLDSKGYPLVTCHNTDRLLVPWDLGWSDKAIRFHLIKVHY